MRTVLYAKNSSAALLSDSFAYDAALRLQSVSDGVNSAGYSYLANSALVSQITFAQSGTTKMTTAKSYDYLNRLTAISSSTNSVTVASAGYGYNAINQRTSLANADGTYWNYAYDSLGQVTAGTKHWPGGQVVAGQQFGYGFDDIGNRTSTQAGGNEFGASLRNASYTANSLNQYTSRTVPGAVDIIGSATNAATVLVNGQAVYRHGDYYRSELTINNTSAGVWEPVTNTATLNNGTSADIIATNTGNLFLPKATESYTYDADGNLTSDGRFTNLWDGHNQLVNITSKAGAATGSLVKLDLTYDYTGRRIQKIVSTNNGSAYYPAYTNRYVYDGWNLVAILDCQSSLIASFNWGKDLSGGMQGAGGVGGLVSMTVASGANAGTYFYAYDGNGNVTALTKASDSTIVAQYEYGPFGELIRATGPVAFANPFRFSTKYQDDETGFLYYGYRYYNTGTGRWPNRDPIAEIGGLNLYGFVLNNPPESIDSDGLDVVDTSRNRVEMTRLEYDNYSKQCGVPMTANRSRLLDNGCVGICQMAQGQDANAQQYPENYGDTKCYLEEKQARSRKCKDCKRKVVWSKMGTYKNGIGNTPTPGTDGTVPNDSVSANANGTFNYVTIAQNWYYWANNALRPGEWPDQKIVMSKIPCNDDHYPDKIWCATCIK